MELIVAIRAKDSDHPQAFPQAGDVIRPERMRGPWALAPLHGPLTATP